MSNQSSQCKRFVFIFASRAGWQLFSWGLYRSPQSQLANQARGRRRPSVVAARGVLRDPSRPDVDALDMDAVTRPNSLMPPGPISNRLADLSVRSENRCIEPVNLVDLQVCEVGVVTEFAWGNCVCDCRQELEPMS